VSIHCIVAKGCCCKATMVEGSCAGRAALNRSKFTSPIRSEVASRSGERRKYTKCTVCRAN
jgi:hypothetical protein